MGAEPGAAPDCCLLGGAELPRVVAWHALDALIRSARPRASRPLGIRRDTAGAFGAMTFMFLVSNACSLCFGQDFLATWPAAWGTSWLVAFSTLLLLLPIVRHMVALVVATSGS